MGNAMLGGAISSSEPQDLKELLHELIVSVVPEEYGSDVLLATPRGLVGIQRKDVDDFIASISDGRLNRECALMEEKLTYRVLILEGKLHFHQGTLRNAYKPTQWTKIAISNILRSLYYIRGIRVEATENIEDTAQAVRQLYSYFSENRHMSLYTRPALQGEWGKISVNERDLWILQGFPGIGPVLAQSIIKHFGKLPLVWSCSEEQLRQVAGIGKLRAKKLLEVLEEVL